MDEPPKVTITMEPPDPEWNRRTARFRRNGEWLSEHALEVYPNHLGKVIGE